MDLDRLELLLDVVKRGSFADAARVRSVAPSSVSRAIAGLEDELGLRLLHRTTRKLTLTEAGARYVDRIGPLVAGLDDAARFARDAEEVPAGVVRATVPVSFLLAVLGPLLPELRERWPAITLDLVASDVRLDLLDARVDFAVRLGRLSDPSLVARKLFTMRYRCVAAPRWASQVRGPADLASIPCLRFPLPAYSSAWRFDDGDIVVDGPLIVGNTLALREAAIAGLGATVLPMWLVGDALRAGALVDLFPEHGVTLSTFDAAAWLVFPARRYIPARVRVVTDFLVERLSGTSGSFARSAPGRRTTTE